MLPTIVFRASEAFEVTKIIVRIAPESLKMSPTIVFITPKPSGMAKTIVFTTSKGLGMLPMIVFITSLGLGDAPTIVDRYIQTGSCTVPSNPICLATANDMFPKYVAIVAAAPCPLILRMEPTG